MTKKRSGTKKALPKQDQSGTVTFDYIKSNYFRVVHVDGVFGAPSARGNMIEMSVWSERRAIPDQVTHKLDSAGKIGEEIERKSPGTMIRELEAGLIFEVQLAKAIVGWLQDQIRQIEEKKNP